jgi:hypothetical protein
VTLSHVSGEYILSSSGYDQRFKKWTIDLASFTAKLKEVKRHCMSDMNSIGKCDLKQADGVVVGSRVILVGQGLSMF